MNITKYNIFLVSLTIIFVFIGLISIIFSLPLGEVYNQDDASSFAPAIMAMEHGSLIFKDINNENFNTFCFKPLGYEINSKKELFPSGFIGLKLIVLMVYPALGNVTITVLTAFFYLLSALFLLLIIRRIAQQKSFILLTIFFFSISAYMWVLSATFFPDIPSLSMILGCIFFLIKYKQENKKSYFYLSSIFLSISFLMKIYNALFLPVMLFILLDILIIRKTTISILSLQRIFRKDKIRLIIELFVIIFILLLPQFYINYVGYGSPIKFTYTSEFNPYQNITKSALPLDKPSFIEGYLIPKENGKIYFNQLKFLPGILINANFVFIFLIFGLPFMYKRNKLLFEIIIFTFFLFFFIFGNMNVYYGVGTTSLRSSFVRYMILPITLLFIVSIYGFHKVISNIKNRLLSTFILTTMIILTISAIQSYGYINTRDYPSMKQIIHDVDVDVLSKTENNSIILSVIDDGVLLNKRQICYYSMIPDDYQISEIKDMINEANIKGIQIYLFRPKYVPNWWSRSGFYMFNITVNKISNFYQDMNLSNKNYELYKLK